MREFVVVRADQIAPLRLARGRRFEPAENIEQGRFAGIGRRQQRD
jgi:hypothetical protein